MFNRITNGICALITILMVIPVLIDGFNIYLTIIYIIVIPMIYAIPVIFKYRGRIISIIKYYCGVQKYNVELRETVYRFLSRTNMEHIKHFKIKSRINGLNEYSTRVGWSKDGEIDIVPYNDKHTIVRKWKNDKMTHLTMLFDRYYKRGEMVETGILVKNLYDPQMESLLYLSTGIFENTKKVCLRVEFAKNLQPKDIQLSYFKKYFDPYPTFVKTLTYNYENSMVEFVENYPIIGSKYLITWDFDN